MAVFTWRRLTLALALTTGLVLVLAGPAGVAETAEAPAPPNSPAACHRQVVVTWADAGDGVYEYRVPGGTASSR